MGEVNIYLATPIKETVSNNSMTTPIEVTVLWPHPLKKQYPIIL